FSKHCHICLGYLWVMELPGRHQAVCGSNGRMYKSLCSFQRAQCINRRLRTAAVSTCTGEVHHREQRLLISDALKSKCQLARSQALRASAHSDSSAVFIPECKADGTYTEVQCHNQTGYCWCSSPDGIPMSGSSVLHLRPNCTGESCLRAQSTITVPPFWATILLNSDPNGNRSVRRPADSLKTCKHERMSVLTEAAIRGSEERFVPECSADGRYRAVQCHSSTGYCWCVRVDSGRPVPRTSASLFDSLQYIYIYHYISYNMSFAISVCVCVGCPSVRKAEFLKSLIQAFQQEVESGASYSQYRLEMHTSITVIRHHDIDEREARPLRLLLRRTLRPRRCAKKFMQFCDQNADRHLSAQELTSCLGI
uniref:SPARC-related modular calcium-binding protein 1-like n=1 Tax=Sinocyclocheilus rhinocerous TaxID=307959 RepID=A0A673HR78_9TELE